MTVFESLEHGNAGSPIDKQTQRTKENGSSMVFEVTVQSVQIETISIELGFVYRVTESPERNWCNQFLLHTVHSATTNT